MVRNVHLLYFLAAAWQSRIAAKPVQGVVGFLVAAYIWFAIPVSISTTTGLAYLATASENTTNMLSAENIDKGKSSGIFASQGYKVYFVSDVPLLINS